MAISRRDHLLHTALKLFNEFGFHATGIDKVQAESGVSKTTMYKYFKSKEELIQAVLELRHEQFGEWIRTKVDQYYQLNYLDQQAGKIYAIFDALNDWFYSDDFCGCNFINASAEFSELDHPIHRVATDHKKSLGQYVKDLLPEMSDSNKEELSLEVCLLLDGAIVCAHTTGRKESAHRAKNMFKRLLPYYQN
jgi:AcrR family transcriptional regulator